MTLEQMTLGSIRRLRPAVALALALAVSGSALAMEGLRIAGDVLNLEGQPVVEAEVLMSPSTGGQLVNGGVPMRAKTNKKGHFTFAFGKPGEYQLSVTVPELAMQKIAIKIRDASKKPMTMADGTELTDIEGAVDPSKKSITVGIPKGAFYVDLVVTMGPPVAARQATQADPAAVAAASTLKELNQGRDDLLAGNFEAAVTEIDAALAKKDLIQDPKDIAIAEYMKGYALFKLGRLEQAQAALANATAADPAMMEAYAMRGAMLAEGKHFDEAAEAFRKALELNTDPARKPALLSNLGKSLVEAGKADQAVVYLEEARTLAPDDTDVLVNLVDVYTRLGRTDDASKLISDQLPPKEAATLHFNIAANLANSKNYAGAEEHFRSVIALDPTLVSAQRYLADVLVAQEKRVEAIDVYEGYLKADPGASDAAEVKQMIDALKKSLPKGGAAKKK